MTKPNWSEYFLNICTIVAMRSPDPRTKHGCVIVDCDNRILSTGYNGSPMGVEDDIIDWNSDEKYQITIHSEANAIITAAKNGTRLDGSTAYITGPPCLQCLCKLINAGVMTIVHGKIKSHCMSEEDHKLRENIIQQADIRVVEIDHSDKLLKNTIEYLNNKLNGV